MYLPMTLILFTNLWNFNKDFGLVINHIQVLLQDFWPFLPVQCTQVKEIFILRVHLVSKFQLRCVITCKAAFRKLYKRHNHIRIYKSSKLLIQYNTKYKSQFCQVKLKWSRYRPGVAQRVGRGIALFFHDRSTRSEWSAARPGRTLPPGKDPVPILQEAGWAPRAGLDGWKISSPTGFDIGPSGP